MPRKEKYYSTPDAPPVLPGRDTRGMSTNSMAMDGGKATWGDSRYWVERRETRHGHEDDGGGRRRAPDGRGGGGADAGEQGLVPSVLPQAQARVVPKVGSQDG